MSEFPVYQKIMSVYKRDEHGHFIDHAWTTDTFKYLADATWRWTEKIDGMNVRVAIDPCFPEGSPLVTFGGRTDNAQMPIPLLEKLHELFSDLEKLTTVLTGPVVLYGEGYGGRIQKAAELYGPDPQFIVFDIWVADEHNAHGGFWLMPDDVFGICNGLGLDMVPFVGLMTLRHAINRVRNRDFESAWGKFPPEGLVGTPAIQLFDRFGHRIIVKVKDRDFDHVRKEPALVMPREGATRTGANEWTYEDKVSDIVFPPGGSHE